MELCNTGTGARYQISPITTINSIITARLLPGSESGQYKEVLIGPNGPEEDIFNQSQLCCWAFEFFCILSPDNETMHENRLKHNDIYLRLFVQISYICTLDKIFRMFMFLLSRMMVTSFYHDRAGLLCPMTPMRLCVSLCRDTGFLLGCNILQCSSITTSNIQSLTQY